MAKFATGFLLGAAAGTIYALATAKSTGAQKQAHASAYVNDLTQGTKDLQQAVKRFGKAVADLRQATETTLKPAVADIEQSVQDFQFQTAPRVAAINDHLNVIDAAVADLEPKDAK